MLTGKQAVLRGSDAGADGSLDRPRLQAHGIVMILSEPGHTIDAISEHLDALIGIPAVAVLGAGVGALMDDRDAREFEERLRRPPLVRADPLAVTLRGRDGPRGPFECSVHRSDDGRLVVELEPSRTPLERPVYTNVQAPIERLQSAADIPALLASVAADIRELSGFARTVVYAVDADWNGDVVAESAAPASTPSLVGCRIPARDIPAELRGSFLRAPLHAVVDAEADDVGLLARENVVTRQLDVRRANLRAASAFHRSFVLELGGRAALTMPIVVRGRFWGLIACIDPMPRRLGSAQRALCELLGHMLAWQLGARLETRSQRLATREAALLAEIAASLEAVDRPAAALTACAPQLCELFGADGVAIRVDGRVRRHGSVPGDDATLDAVVAALVGSDAGAEPVVASHRLGVRAPASGGAAPAGALCIRLADAGDAYVLLLRSETTETITWLGSPPAGPKRRADARHAPFARWHERMRGRSRPWTAADLAVARTLAMRLLAHVRAPGRDDAETAAPATVHLAQRNGHAQALIALQQDVAAALPSREAVVEVVLAFARAQTGADGAALERASGDEFVVDAAAGSLAGQVGRRYARAGSFAGASVDVGAAMACDDASAVAGDAERALYARLGIGSLLVVPVAVAPDATYVLKVVDARRGAFGYDETQTLKLAATNLLSALRAAQKFTALAAAELEQRTYARQLRALHAIASTTTSNRKEQIDAALHLGLEQLGLNWAFLGVIDYATQELVIENSVSNDGRLVVCGGTRMPLGETVLSRAGLSKRLVIVQDVALIEDAPAFEGWSSYIAAPLLIGGATYGVIGFTSREVRAEPFSEANVEFLAVAAELIASAVERGLQRDELERSQTRYRALIEAIPQKLWVVDADNRFEYVNERWTEYTGMTLAQSRIADRAVLFAGGDGILDALPAVEADFEVRLRRADGVYHWHLMRSVPFRAPSGAVDTWLVTATDIEARKAAESVLEGVHDAALAATEAKSRFLATMSHEIRTPMNGVIGMTELLLLTPLNDEQREYTEVIRDSGQSLLRVLNDILDYSKIEAGKLGLETVVFDLPGQVESVVELLRPGFTSKGVSLTTQIAPDIRTTVLGDPGRLRQILLNLTGNALKFTAPGGSVELTLTAGAGDDAVARVHFAIKDTGIGIPPSVLDRLFQPFSQGDESTTRKYGGTGLGLSISAELVALMNGDIGVDSTPDVGSIFWFEIPLRLAPNSPRVADSRERAPAKAQPVPLRSERILLVEDNEINTFLALKQLQRLGFTVDAVDNGLVAVEAIGRERYDLVLMDCHMPEMDGFEATRAIRKHETLTGAHLPIVAMTADARDEDHQNCLAAGMDDYISKPTNLDSLRAILDRWLPAPERRRASRNGSALQSSAPTLGLSMLLELFNGDRAAVFDLLAAALASIGNDLKRIETAVDAHDYETVVEAAHRLKGTSGSIRAGRLVEIAGAIEAEARSAPAAFAPGALADLRAAVNAVTAEVRSGRKLFDGTPPR